MGKKNSEEWCVVDLRDQVLRCKRCGGTHPLNLPQKVTAVTKMARAFSALHAGCEELTRPEKETNR